LVFAILCIDLLRACCGRGAASVSCLHALDQTTGDRWAVGQAIARLLADAARRT
jgi:hypothetical protein